MATALAGRHVEVAPAADGARTWSDGRTIFLEGDVSGRRRVALLGVQASLLAAGSLTVTSARGAVAARYLAIEGHRALAANEAALPRWLQSLIDHELANRVASPQDSLALARVEKRHVPPWEFGALDLRRVQPPEPVTVTAGGVVAADAPEADDDSVNLDLLTSPVGGGGVIGRQLARLLRASRGRDGSGSPSAAAAQRGTGTGRDGVRSAVTFALPDAVDASNTTTPGRTREFLYPEWDFRARAYRPDWCRVQEDIALAGEARDGLADDVALRRALAPLGLGRTTVRRRPQGDDLDIDAVVDEWVARSTGAATHGDVYIERLRQRRDLSVLVLLDVSGSAAEPGTSGRSVHAHQRDAAGALVSALHRLGDRTALYAFRSQGRSAVRVTRVKQFDEGVSGAVAARLAGLQPGAYTRLGAAIRHGANLVDGAGTPRRILVVISDGFAFDHGYETSYGEADARRALDEARRRGIGCVCLSVGAAVDPAALRRVFGSAAQATVPGAAQLPAVVGPMFNAALRAAEAQQRRFERFVA